MKHSSIIVGALVTLALLLSASRGQERQPAAPKRDAADSPIPAEFRKALAKAQTLELYSLDPSTPKEKNDVDFRDWKVLGKTEVKKDALTKLVAALEKGAAEQDQKIFAGGFRPRQGIRVKTDGKPYDFVVCFECISVMLYKDKQRVKGFQVSGSPAATFNQVLRDAKVKLPKPPED